LRMIRLPTEKEFKSMRHFPFMEGKCLEFKKSICDKLKIEATLCAFINTEGGHLICGVCDDRTLNWLNLEDKALDFFLTRIDSIISNRTIRADNGEPLPHDSITACVIRNDKNECIIVLTAKKRTNPDITYTYQGNVIYRLNVSNFYAAIRPSYTASDVYLIKQQVRADTMDEMEHALRSSAKKLQKMEKLNRDYIYSWSKYKESYETIHELLFMKILQEKKEAEEHLVRSKRSCLFSLLCLY
jgi:hypothetical protein